jgi:hypothetical protein
MENLGAAAAHALSQHYALEEKWGYHRRYRYNIYIYGYATAALRDKSFA